MTALLRVCHVNRWDPLTIKSFAWISRSDGLLLLALSFTLTAGVTIMGIDTLKTAWKSRVHKLALVPVASSKAVLFTEREAVVLLSFKLT